MRIVVFTPCNLFFAFVDSRTFADSVLDFLTSLVIDPPGILLNVMQVKPKKKKKNWKGCRPAITEKAEGVKTVPGV
jgi:hypothetical protein